MKKFSFLAVAAAASFVVSCDKPQSEAEKSAQIEREVQQRLAAERQTDEQQRLAQQQAELDAREQAVADREAAARANATARSVAQPNATPRATAVARTSSDTDAPESYDTFYRKLEPFGAWRETSDYGYVWQPQQAHGSGDWRPYADGRWAYTDAGWTWVSEEPFGWATYHYGRWIRLRNVGWVWVPGEEWAPAWVSWRTSDEYVGWAPLPPEARFDRRRGIQRWADSYYDIDADEYVFVPNAAIGSPRLVREVVPIERNVTIVNQTVNVTNITYNNVTIVNEGPNYEHLRARSRHPIQRLRLERRFNAQADSLQAEVRGDVLAVTTPVFAAQAVERPRVLGEPIRQVTVERSWAPNRNEAEAQRAREKMKSEATPPPDAPPKRYDKPKMVQATAAPAATASPTVASTPASTPAVSATASPRPALSPRETASPAIRASASPIGTPVPKSSATATPTASTTATPTVSATATPVGTATASPRPSFTPRARPSVSAAPSASPVPSATVAPALSGAPVTTPPRAGSSPSVPSGMPAQSATPASDPDQTPVDPQSNDASRLREGRQRPGLGAGENDSGQGLPRDQSRKPKQNRAGSPEVPINTDLSTPAARGMTPPPATRPLPPRSRPATPANATPPAATPQTSTTTVPAATPELTPSATAAATTPSGAAVGAQNDPAGSTRPERNGRGINRRPQRPVPADTDPNATPSASPEDS